MRLVTPQRVRAMKLRRRIERLERQLPPVPTPAADRKVAWSVETLAERLRALFVSTLARWCCPQLWTLLRDFRAKRDEASERRLSDALSAALAEDAATRGLANEGLCNASRLAQSEFNYQRGEVTVLKPSPPCPRCGVRHSDDIESLRLARDRNSSYWSNQAADRATRDDEALELAKVMMPDNDRDAGEQGNGTAGEN